jgi:hypothetical protein
VDKHVQGAGVSGEEHLVSSVDGIHNTMPRSIHYSASPLDFAQGAFRNASRKSMLVMVQHDDSGRAGDNLIERLDGGGGYEENTEIDLYGVAFRGLSG